MKSVVYAVLALFTILSIRSADAKVVATPGDVIVTSSRPGINDDGETYYEGTLVVFGRDGQLKGELAVFSEPPLSDPLVRDGIIYVATRYPPGIQRFDLTGQQLPPLTTNVNAVNYLAPGPNGGLLAVNGSCELYQFADDGSLLFRDRLDPPACGGVELLANGCSVFFVVLGRIAHWDACTYPSPEFATPNLQVPPFATLRLLNDGSFLVARVSDAPILRLDQQGNVIRDYGINGRGLALDIDGTSFWTNESGWITRVDLTTGAILSRTFHGLTWGLAVVGEPRAGLLAHAAGQDVPLAAPTVLALMAVALVVLAVQRVG